MNRPGNITAYDELDLKLGIKSSLPHVKSTIALALIMWKSANRPSELDYSVQNGNGIVISSELQQRMVDYLSHACKDVQITTNTLETKVKDNPLLTSQLEALIVAFELVWKLAKISFVDTTMIASAERTGGIRYPKKLYFTVNADIIHCLIESNEYECMRILLSWLGFNVDINHKYETQLLCLITYLSEGAMFKLLDGNSSIVFNQNCIYKKLLETHQPVDINGDEESKGPLRILKSSLSEGVNPFLRYYKGTVSIDESRENELAEYQKRVEMYLRLSATKVIGLENLNAINEGMSPSNENEIQRLTTGRNILLYGVPGSGKSWTIEHEYCKPGSVVERIVFHPDYTYSDFVGQILPDVKDGVVSYKFTPGPFTNILSEAYNNPGKEYILIIEEINRGNAPAIFGEVFQLLDRKVEIDPLGDDGFPIGTSVYGITNKNIAECVYGDDNKTEKVRIPSNLSIIGTMNTSDQNVFTLDTAFQRRWDMRLIENNFDNVDSSLADAKILDTDVTWKKFCLAINKIIVGNSARMTSSEDKRLGAYFVHVSDLKYDDRMGDLTNYDELRKKESKGNLTREEEEKIAVIRESMKQNRKFPEKVIKYLWDDAFKFSREIVFDIAIYQSLETVIHDFMYAKGVERFKIFRDDIRSTFVRVDEKEEQ